MYLDVLRPGDATFQEELCYCDGVIHLLSFGSSFECINDNNEL